MDLAETLGRSSGAGELSLIVSESNTPARTLYEKRGFEARGRRASVSSPGAPLFERLAAHGQETGRMSE